MPPFHGAGLGCRLGLGVLPFLAPVEGRCSGYSSSYIWQGSGRIWDTGPDSLAKDLQEVVGVNVQDAGDSGYVKEA